jgi:hypothetical protein
MAIFMDNLLHLGLLKGRIMAGRFIGRVDWFPVEKTDCLPVESPDCLPVQRPDCLPVH